MFRYDVAPAECECVNEGGVSNVVALLRLFRLLLEWLGWLGWLGWRVGIEEKETSLGNAGAAKRGVQSTGARTGETGGGGSGAQSGS